MNRSITKSVLIIEKLRQGGADFREIAAYLEKESDLQGFNLRIEPDKFEDDLQEIYEQLGISIEYNHKTKKYQLSEQSLTNVSRRILETLELFNAFHISERLSDYIEFDKTASQGAQYLHRILKAIEERKIISFVYKSYWVKGKSAYPSVEPLALKEFKNRWYLVGQIGESKKIKVFALERMYELAVSNDHFEYPQDFSVREYFKNCFGIIRPEQESVQTVRLSFDPHEADYLKSLPLHHSQVILIDNEDEFCVGLKINITYDFVKELLAYGSRVKVLEPKSLAQSMYNNAKIVQTYYE